MTLVITDRHVFYASRSIALVYEDSLLIRLQTTM